MEYCNGGTLNLPSEHFRYFSKKYIISLKKSAENIASVMLYVHHVRDWLHRIVSGSLTPYGLINSEVKNIFV